jgi:hypothetical protein
MAQWPYRASTQGYGDNPLKEALPYLSIISSVVAAGLGIRAASVVVRDSLDDFISDISRQGRWASWAAVAAGVSVVLQAIDRDNAGRPPRWHGVQHMADTKRSAVV